MYCVVQAGPFLIVTGFLLIPGRPGQTFPVITRLIVAQEPPDCFIPEAEILFIILTEVVVAIEQG
jgi:hypothetical protein